MMRLRRPWWVVLAAMTLVLASILAPMEAAAYVIDEVADPVAKGDPDDTGPSKVEPAPRVSPASGRVFVFIQPIPGVLLRIQIPTRTLRLSRFIRGVR